MLERMWRKGNPLTLLVQMKIGAATMENSMEVSQKAKNMIPLLGIYPKEMRTLIQKDWCTPMFTATLFAIAKTEAT